MPFAVFFRTQWRFQETDHFPCYSCRIYSCTLSISKISFWNLANTWMGRSDCFIQRSLFQGCGDWICCLFYFSSWKYSRENQQSGTIAPQWHVRAVKPNKFVIVQLTGLFQFSRQGTYYQQYLSNGKCSGFAETALTVKQDVPSRRLGIQFCTDGGELRPKNFGIKIFKRV